MASIEVESKPGSIGQSSLDSPPIPTTTSSPEKERSVSPSCVDYIKKKEMLLYKMMNDSSNRAMLYFLEILMQSKTPMSIEDLAYRLAHKSFSEDMKKACGGGTCEGLKAFFLKYPSLFNVRKDGLVSSIDMEQQDEDENETSLDADTRENDGLSTNPSKSSNESVDEKSDEVYRSPALRGEKVCMINSGDVSTSSSLLLTENYQPCQCTGNYINVSHANIAKESEAVRFFQQRLTRREEKWVQIKSLAGHLSQANQDIRNLVGPQLEFKKFLLKHPHVFEIQGELVSLRETISINSKKIKIQSKTTKSYQTTTVTNGINRRPKSLIMMSPESLLKSAKLGGGNTMSELHTEINRRHSLSSAPVTPTMNGKNGTTATLVQCISTEGLCLSMSANEYRAVMYLRKILEKKNNITLNQLMQYLSVKAPEAIQNIIGWTRIELEEFLNQHDIFFEITPTLLSSGDVKTQSCISTSTNSSSGFSSGQSNNNNPTQAMLINQNPVIIVSNRKFHQTVNILITTGKKADANSTRTLTNKSGRICHVAKLWGIIDLGKHEHVFFDKSLFRYVDDLQKHFKVNELLYFNAILAPKESRAKWRATQVWKECDRENLERLSMPLSVQMMNDRSARNFSETPGDVPFEFLSHVHGGCHSSVGDDTEFEGEMDDYDLMPLEQAGKLGDSDILTSEVEDQLNAILGPVKPVNHRKINDYLTVTDEVWGLGTEEDLSYCGTISSEISASNHNVQMTSRQANLDGHVTSSTNDNGLILIPEKASLSSSSLASLSKVSVGCQTLATGDIMASQLFHESMSKLV